MRSYVSQSPPAGYASAGYSRERKRNKQDIFAKLVRTEVSYFGHPPDIEYQLYCFTLFMR
jgi:hypothetical protein